ncbi:MAG: 2-deoxy-5-keto-D-gluconate 6-phosphate aldolase domain-containing protein [Acidimicrobiia bacterium]
MTLGYDQNLYILAFDHRGSFEKMFGVKGTPSDDEVARIRDGKAVIFEGFSKAISEGAPPDAAGVLTDEQYGADLARKAKANGWTLAMPVEKSGIDYFDFEYGADFGAHIEEFDPTFSKILVRYNPDGSAEDNEKSRTGLKKLNDWLKEKDRKFLFELLVPAEDAQLASVAGDSDRYDAEVRPGLMRTAIAELQDAGIEPDVWKIEGIDTRGDCDEIAAQARSGGRDHVGCVVLGRGADSAKVDHWLQQGAGRPGYIGFAIGRTIWSDGLAGWRDAKLSREDATAQIAANYLSAIKVWDAAGG